MKTHKIFSSPEGINEAVKQGWSWPGFFFGPFWALFKKMWGLGIGVMVLFFVLGVIEVKIEILFGAESVMMAGFNLINSIIGFVTAIMFGNSGNGWREKNLASRGFDCQDTVRAGSPGAAVSQWLKESKLE